MSMDTLLRNMEYINAIADALLDMLNEDPKAQALALIIRDFSNVEDFA